MALEQQLIYSSVFTYGQEWLLENLKWIYMIQTVTSFLGVGHSFIYSKLDMDVRGNMDNN